MDDELEDKAILARPDLLSDPAFVHRITAHAFAQPRKPSLWQQYNLFWDDVAQSVAIPKPALTFALLALFGFVIGAISESDNSSMSIASVMYETREMI